LDTSRYHLRYRPYPDRCLRGKRGLETPLPWPILQQQFAQIVQKYERLRAQQREAERQAEHLFQTLLHRAFHGELESGDEVVADIQMDDEASPPEIDQLEAGELVGMVQQERLPLEYSGEHQH
jgi:hypothetical protein